MPAFANGIINAVRNNHAHGPTGKVVIERFEALVESPPPKTSWEPAGKPPCRINVGLQIHLLGNFLPAEGVGGFGRFGEVPVFAGTAEEEINGGVVDYSGSDAGVDELVTAGGGAGF